MDMALLRILGRVIDVIYRWARLGRNRKPHDTQ